MASVVTQSLTAQRDQLQIQSDTAEQRLSAVENEVLGFKKLCYTQNNMLQESSEELQALRDKLSLVEGEMRKHEKAREKDKVVSPSQVSTAQGTAYLHQYLILLISIDSD